MVHYNRLHFSAVKKLLVTANCKLKRTVKNKGKRQNSVYINMKKYVVIFLEQIDKSIENIPSLSLCVDEYLSPFLHPLIRALVGNGNSLYHLVAV